MLFKKVWKKGWGTRQLNTCRRLPEGQGGVIPVPTLGFFPRPNSQIPIPAPIPKSFLVQSFAEDGFAAAAVGAVAAAETGEGLIIEEAVIEDGRGEQAGEAWFGQVEHIAVESAVGVGAEDHADGGGIAGGKFDDIDIGGIALDIFGAEPA